MSCTYQPTKEVTFSTYYIQPTSDLANISANQWADLQNFIQPTSELTYSTMFSQPVSWLTVLYSANQWADLQYYIQPISCPWTGAMWRPPLWSPYVVCVHIYIYVVCEPHHGESTTSAALYYIRNSGFNIVIYKHSEQSFSPSHQALSPSLPPFPRRVDSCTVCSCLQTSPRGLVITPTPPSHSP